MVKTVVGAFRAIGFGVTEVMIGVGEVMVKVALLELMLTGDTGTLATTPADPEAASEALAIVTVNCDSVAVDGVRVTAFPLGGVNVTLAAVPFAPGNAPFKVMFVLPLPATAEEGLSDVIDGATTLNGRSSVTSGNEATVPTLMTA